MSNMTSLPDITLEKRLHQHVAQLAGEIGERNVYRPHALHEAERYIRDVWSGQGHRVQEQEYVVSGVRSANLEVVMSGQHDGLVVVVGAHYDSVIGSPGADDNGSGVAVLLELGRLLMGAQLGCTLRLVAFVNEEPPFFFTKRQGSWVYAQAVRERCDPISFMLSLEMLGYYRDSPGSQNYPPLFRWFYPDRANFIALVSNFSSWREMRRFAATFRRVSTFPLEQVATFSWIPGVAWSDHLSFWREGYRAMMLTDTAFFRNPHYHAATDTPPTLDYQRMATLTEGVADALMQLFCEAP
jgi:Zn-dependent M28 family amino/carboxypeptidase